MTKNQNEDTSSGERPAWASPGNLEASPAFASPALRRFWDTSSLRLQELRQVCAPLFSGAEWATLAVSGSYARREAGPAADLDLVFLTSSDANSASAGELMQEIFAQTRFPTPRPTGIFAQPIPVSRLFEAPLGQIDEAPLTFGLRMQALLDMQPMWNEAGFRDIQQRIVARYAMDHVQRHDNKQWIYLINDLMRYHRCLFLKYQWESREVPGRWAVRNLKGRHTRAVSHAGLLFLLGESGIRGAAKIPWLLEQLKLTPIQRLRLLFTQYGDPSIAELEDRYGAFIDWVGDPEQRAAFESATQHPSDFPGSHPLYESWCDNADAMQWILIRFLHKRERDWSERFVQRLYF